MIFSDLPNSNSLASPVALLTSGVRMVSYRTGWNALQPTEPVGGVPTSNPSDSSWNWDFFDSAIGPSGQATLANIPAFLRVFFQDSNTPNWIQSIVPQFVSISGASLNFWGNATFQGYVAAVIQAIANRYGSNPLIKVLSFNIVTTRSGDWSLPHVITGGNWTNTSSFTIPAVGSTGNAQTGGTSAGMHVGQYCFIPGGGWYYATFASGSMHTTLFNPGTAGNASPGTVIAANTTIQVNDVLTLQGPIFSYTTAGFVSAAAAITAITHTAFPNALIDQEVGRNGTLDPYPPGSPTYQYNAATQLAQLGFATYPVGTFSIGKNTINTGSSLPAAALVQTDNSDLYLPAQCYPGSSNTSGTTGVIPARSLLNGQFSWQAYDPTGEYSPITTASAQKPYAANNGIPYTNPIPVWQKTIAIAQAFGMNIVEIYEGDAIYVLPRSGSYSYFPQISGYMSYNRYYGQTPA